MEDSFGENISKFCISMNEMWALLKWIGPTILLPVTIAFIGKQGFREGLIGGFIVSTMGSVFISFFLALMIKYFAKIKVFSKGIAAMDSRGNTGARIEWSKIHQVTYGSFFNIKTIELTSVDEKKIVLFNNLKDKGAFVKTINQVAGADNPLTVFLNQK